MIKNPCLLRKDRGLDPSLRVVTLDYAKSTALCHAPTRDKAVTRHHTLKKICSDFYPEKILNCRNGKN